MTPPCGVPVVVSFRTCISSMTPASSHIRISFTTDRSMTLDRTDSSKRSCGIRSKYDLISASTTRRQPDLSRSYTSRNAW